MKKVPSYPKITAKTNITVTQTQNININSPKGFNAKKVFKKDSKKNKNGIQGMKNDHSNYLFVQEAKKTIEPIKKSVKKMSVNQNKDSKLI